jgi:hypothetical protein
VVEYAFGDERQPSVSPAMRFLESGNALIADSLDKEANLFAISE